MTSSEPLPLTRKCKQCGRRFAFEAFVQVETRWRPNKHSQWRIMCTHCARAYADYMIASGAEGAPVPEVVLHGV